MVSYIAEGSSECFGIPQQAAPISDWGCEGKGQRNILEEMPVDLSLEMRTNLDRKEEVKRICMGVPVCTAVEA